MRILNVCFIFLLFVTHANAQQVKNIYVSPNGSDINNGTIKSPVATINKAQQLVRNLKSSVSSGTIFVNLRAGTYELTSPIKFGIDDGGSTSLKVKFTAYKNEKVVISGGKTLAHSWQQSADKNGRIWKLKIPEAANRNWVFHSLFINNKRVDRATSDTLFTKGPLPTFTHSYKVYDFKSIAKLLKDSLNAFCGFTYNNNDLSNVNDLASAEIIIYNSWDASWHTIYKVDATNNQVYLKNPLTYPIGFFNKRERYIIKNSKDFFTKAGQWYLDTKAGELSYYALPGENPNKMNFVVPKLQNLVTMKVTDKNASINNVSFNNINFYYAASAWGVHLLTYGSVQPNIDNVPGLNLSEGYSSNQSAMGCGESVLLIGATGCSFINCEFAHSDNYGLRIGEFSDKNIVTNCSFNDLGGGGVIVGFDNFSIPIGDQRNEEGLPPTVSGVLNQPKWAGISPTGNMVSNCIIKNCGVVHPAGVGIGIMHANHSIVNNNLISNLPYIGISVGWWQGYVNDFNSYNIVKNNQINNVMTALADGGGIYTIGKQTGTVYSGNYIHSITRSPNAVGAKNNGFFFDQMSSGFTVDSNVVFSIKNEDFRFNGADSLKIKFGKNYFEKSKANKNLYLKMRSKAAQN